MNIKNLFLGLLCLFPLLVFGQVNENVPPKEKDFHFLAVKYNPFNLIFEEIRFDVEVPLTYKWSLSGGFALAEYAFFYGGQLFGNPTGLGSPSGEVFQVALGLRWYETSKRHLDGVYVEPRIEYKYADMERFSVWSDYYFNMHSDTKEVRPFLWSIRIVARSGIQKVIFRKGLIDFHTGLGLGLRYLDERQSTPAPAYGPGMTIEEEEVYEFMHKRPAKTILTGTYHIGVRIGLGL